MREHNHEYLIRCVDFQVDKRACYIFMELANEDLHTYIQRRRIEPRSFIHEKTVLYIIFQVLHGLKYLHERNIIYRDLKPLNTLMIGLDCKLSDFGGAKRLSNPQSMAISMQGTE